MNKQQAFDKVWKHFVVEKNPAGMHDIRGLSVCRYFNEANGAKCGVGCLMTDEEAARMPRVGVKELWDRWWLPTALRELGIEFLADLQRAHDHAALVDTHLFHDNIETALNGLKAKWLP